MYRENGPHSSRIIDNKKLSCHKETMRLLRGTVLAKYNWKMMFFGHYGSIFQPLWRNRPAKLSNSVK